MEQNEKMKPESFKSRIDRDVAEGKLTREDADKIVDAVRAKYDEIAAKKADPMGFATFKVSVELLARSMFWTGLPVGVSVESVSVEDRVLSVRVSGDSIPAGEHAAELMVQERRVMADVTLPGDTAARMALTGDVVLYSWLQLSDGQVVGKCSAVEYKRLEW